MRFFQLCFVALAAVVAASAGLMFHNSNKLEHTEAAGVVTHTTYYPTQGLFSADRTLVETTTNKFLVYDAFLPFDVQGTRPVAVEVRTYRAGGSYLCPANRPAGRDGCGMVIESSIEIEARKLTAPPPPSP
ncbi:hypothetical protein LXM94_25490 [Rhizobium sp. TRM95111]|uniref:hypothetical protein n=1 Tax=Rhizobium alarense TaxID=2846851 RepID=UPI001F19F41D|nr:hypothetical protein [Rhizobium alarense]MCF3643311.1 hypothetical protein [Rhizobium alarense]